MTSVDQGIHSPTKDRSCEKPRIKTRVRSLAVLSAAVTVIGMPGLANAESKQVIDTGRLHMAQSKPGTQQTQNAQMLGSAASSTTMSLDDLERLATQNNPTLAQAEAAIGAARARSRQAGLPPNPVVGYNSTEFAFRSLGAKPEYYGFVEQTIPMGGKLKKSRRIYEREAAQLEIEAIAQKQRVLNTIRTLFYEALGAQQQVDLQTELSRIAHDATATTSQLFNVGQADQPDFLESEIEAEQVEHSLQVAKNDLEQTWKALASVMGTPTMSVPRLTGNLEERITPFDQEQLLAMLISDSPQIKSAQAQIDHAQAVLIRAKAEPIPDLFLLGGLGYSSEFLDTGSTNSDSRPPKTGFEAYMQVGMTLPLWNRNQGGIAAAKAELTYAQSELERLKLSLRVRFAQTVRNYYNALDAVRRFKTVILPRADKAYEMYLSKFKQMSASYPQVLISQRTMFQVRRQYINALVDLRQNATQIEGFLLTGGLDTPRLRPENTVERVEMTGVRSGSQGSESSLDSVNHMEGYE